MNGSVSHAQTSMVGSRIKRCKTQCKNTNRIFHGLAEMKSAGSLKILLTEQEAEKPMPSHEHQTASATVIIHSTDCKEVSDDLSVDLPGSYHFSTRIAVLSPSAPSDANTNQPEVGCPKDSADHKKKLAELATTALANEVTSKHAD